MIEIYEHWIIIEQLTIMKLTFEHILNVTYELYKEKTNWNL